MGEDFSRQTRISNAVWAENLPLRHARGDSKQAIRVVFPNQPLIF